MSALRRLASRVRAMWKLSEITKGSDAWQSLFGPSTPVPTPTEQTIRQISAFHACERLISCTIASLPMRIYRRTADGERDELPSDPLWWVLNEEFSPRWSAATGWEYIAASMLHHGDAFALIARKGGAVDGIVPIHPDRVIVAPWPDGSRLAYVVSADTTIPNADLTKLTVYDQDDVLHFTGPGFDGCRSLSALKYHLSMAGGLALATQEYAATFFANSARPDYALVGPAGANISPDAAARIKAEIEEKYGSPEKRHRPMVLYGGMKIEKITMPMDEIQLLQSRQFSVEEIARICGVPPFMIGHNEKTTSFGTGIESMGAAFKRYTIGGYLTRIQNEINRKFFKNAGKVADFDTFELEKSDMKSLFSSYRIALGRAGEPAFMDVGEVRQRLSLKRQMPQTAIQRGSRDAPQPPA